MKASVKVYHTDEEGIVVDSDYEGDFRVQGINLIAEFKSLLLELGLVTTTDDLVFTGDVIEGFFVTADDIVKTPLFSIDILD